MPCAAAGKTIFFSSHILSEIEAIADRVAVIRDGKIVLSDELDSLRQTQKVLRLTYRQWPSTEETLALHNLPGVLQVEHTVRLRVEGGAEALARTLRERLSSLRDVEMVTVSLEDILLESIGTSA